MNPYRPGPGWRPAGCPVYDHVSGIRIHAYGMYWPPGSKVSVNGRVYPESLRLHRFIAINGGNRKRGVMAWALAMCKKGGERSDYTSNPQDVVCRLHSSQRRLLQG